MLKKLNGRLKVVKGGWRGGDNKKELLEEPMWGDLKFLKGAIEVPNYLSKTCQ